METKFRDLTKKAIIHKVGARLFAVLAICAVLIFFGACVCGGK